MPYQKPFAKSEYAARVTQTKARMRDAGFDLVLCQDPASLRPGDKTLLEAGMCFHFQSGVWLDDFGAAVSEPFVVTENGGERLCDVQRGLVIID